MSVCEAAGLPEDVISLLLFCHQVQDSREVKEISVKRLEGSHLLECVKGAEFMCSCVHCRDLFLHGYPKNKVAVFDDCMQ
jgi:hypothetical protein